MITLDHLRAVMLGAAPESCARYLGPLNDTMARFGIEPPARAAMFLAHLAHESAELRHCVENLNYSAGALRRVWPSRFSAEDATRYARRPELIASRAYADRMGNGSEASGDGWRYRGRGLIQITGRDNYRECGAYLDHDFLAEPDDMAALPWACLSAGWFWSSRGLNAFADRDDVTGATRRINGGTNGLAERIAFHARAKAALAL